MGTSRTWGLAVWSALLAALLGCGGSKAPGTSADGAAPVELSGTIGGRTFVAKDALIATTLSWKSSLYPGDSTLILLADSTALCDQIQTNITKANTQLLILDLAEAGAGTAQPITSIGTFPISGDLSMPRAAFAAYTYTDPQCAFSDLVAESGSIVLTNLGQGASSALGSLSVTFTGGASLSGTLSASSTCPSSAVDAYLNKNPTCP